MGRQWSRHHASLEDIKRCRKEILGKYPNATDIFFDEYLVETHQNDYGCSANKFYYGAVMETKDGRFQAATAYGRIGEHLENRKAFGGLKAFDEGVFTNFQVAKDKLNDKLDKKKIGKKCKKCRTRQSYSSFAPKNAETFEEEYECSWCGKDVKNRIHGNSISWMVRGALSMWLFFQRVCRFCSKS